MKLCDRSLPKQYFTLPFPQIFIPVLIYSTYSWRFTLFSVQKSTDLRHKDTDRRERTTKRGCVLLGDQLPFQSQVRYSSGTLLSAARIEPESPWEMCRGWHIIIQLHVKSGGERQGRMCGCAKNTWSFFFLTPFLPHCGASSVSHPVVGTWDLKCPSF